MTVDIEESSQEETERNFLLLSVAYAANIGGMAVVTGTPPNLVAFKILDGAVTFPSWIGFARKLSHLLSNLILLFTFNNLFA